MADFSRFSRRYFLERSFATAAAGLAAAGVAQSAFGAKAADARGPSTRPSGATTKPSSANERIGVAVVGLHGRGQSHIDAYSYADNVEIVALCDPDQSTFGKAQSMLQEKNQ